VLALSNSITLDQPLANNHEIDDVVLDEKVTTAGYQGTPEPDQWFGGPALSTSAGNMVLRDAKGNVVDGLNYGLLVDPWTAEGYQGKSGTGEGGCLVPSPVISRGRNVTSSASQPNRSAGRYPDGIDSDFNCKDFMLQNTITLATQAKAGSNNLKVANAGNLVIGQMVIIGHGSKSESAIIGIIGTAGGSTVGSATKTGVTAIPVTSIEGFNAGQTIIFDSGSNLETAVIASTAAGRRRQGGAPGGNNITPMDTIKITRPLKFAHSAGSPVSGSGITLSTPLAMTHEAGEQVASSVPTPGEPNQYVRRP
jgi:hypothetical protein